MRGSVLIPLMMLILNSIFAQLLILDDFEAVVNSNTNIGLPNTFFQFPLGSIVVGFNLAAGALMIVMMGITLGVIAGIRISVVATTVQLSETSVRAVLYGVTFYGMWAVLSVFGSPLIFMIPLFGIPLYFVLTIFYCIGVFEMMGGHS